MFYKGCDGEFEILMNVEIFLKIFFRKLNYLIRIFCVGVILCLCSVNYVILNFNCFEVE